jgi:formimidoylglutamate deiminase
MSRLLLADLTWTGERFESGVQIAIDDNGRIIALEGSPDPSADRLKDVALLPGMINTHSHAFQRGLRGRGESFPSGAGSFWTWREAMYGLVTSLNRDGLRRLSAQAFAEMRDAGITSVGEFHYLHHEHDTDFALDEAVLEAARDSGIRMVLLYSYYATSAPGRPLEGAQRRFATPTVEGFWRQVERLAQRLDPHTQTLGIAPHSIRAASPQDIALLYAEAARRGLPVHLHVEEQQREIEECVAAYGKAPMALILEAVEGGSFTAVHCTHTSESDLKRFFSTGGVACLCPLTEGNLGDGIPRLPAGESARARLALGTDSNNRLAMLEEMRWLEYGQRLGREMRGALADSTGRLAPVLLAAATLGGAKALALPAGKIAAGCWADLVAIDLQAPSLAQVSPDHLLDAMVFGAGNEVILGTYVGGRWRPTGQSVEAVRA